jgi:spermidine synthase
MSARVLRVAPLLFGSGFTALVYQIAWMQELRLVFGFSTAASAAVVAIFLGGLGLGSFLLGGRADRSPRPLVLYGRLELSIAAAAAATPALVWLARQAYVAVGGSFALGLAAGTALRLVLAALVLLVPTALMGGTLPAASRAVETDADHSRRNVAILYGANTLGATLGAALSTFWLLEVLGTRSTLWLACAVNAGLGLAAVRIGRGVPVPPGPEPDAAAPAKPPAAEGATASPWRFTLGAAAVTGFAFAAMELVWYRMLSPLLGGSTYTFGLILAVALAGVGFGAALYGLSGSRPASFAALAVTCALEALFVAAPYGLGDRLAIWAALLRSAGALGFAGLVASWAAVAGLAVFPAACVAGFQFPLLVALVGRGRAQVGRHVGAVYAWNTGGAIAGSLAAGFVLLPAVSAPGSWVAIVCLLAATSAGALALSVRKGAPWRSFAAAPVLLVAGLALVGGRGPTSVWRHSPIGAGRVQLAGSSPNGITDWTRSQRRMLDWEREGRESSVALLKTSVGFAFAINGKVDGSAIGDAPTQVMGGLVVAALHPAPKRALVVGLGTGSTAGWLAAVPTIERVDVVELEPAVLEVARRCAPVNRDVLGSPKVRVQLGDAREFLLTTRETYDVIFSEPSNPYRAGISSLFTQEFYRAAKARLSPAGLFAQWLQAYEVDGDTVRVSYKTLAGSFGSVETWFTKKDDLLLVASAEPQRRVAEDLRRRVRQAPFDEAMARAWRVSDLEGFLSHFVARDALARAVARLAAVAVNTDDRNAMEFGFARSVGQPSLFQSDELRRLARERREDRPVLEGEVDWARVESDRLASLAAEEATTPAWPEMSASARQRLPAYARYVDGNLGDVRAAWLSAPWEPAGPLELVMVGEALADGADARAGAVALKLREFEPAEADAVLARYLWTQQQWEACFVASAAALQRFRGDPWPLPAVMRRLLAVVVDLSGRDRGIAVRGCELLARPFAVGLLDEERASARIETCRNVDAASLADAYRAMEPDSPWQAASLEGRAQAYAAAGDPRASAARADVEAFWKREPGLFAAGLEAR